MGGPGSGAKQFEIDPDALLELIERGVSKKNMAEEVGCSVPTLRSKIAKLQESSPVILEYRTLQTLELTELQSKILSKITDEKIDAAPLRDLVLAYKILKEKEFMVEGKPTEVRGLVHYLLEIEREEEAEKKALLALANKQSGTDEEVEDADFSDVGLEPEEIVFNGLKLSEYPD